MPRAETIAIPLLRRMLVNMRRSRGHEAVVVLDRLPVAIPSAADAEAPVVMRRPPRRDGGRDDIRLLDGMFYVPFDLSGEAGPVGVDRYARWMEDRIRRAFGFPVPRDIERQGKHDPVDWKKEVANTNRKRGLGAEADLPIEIVHDDGRGRQAGILAHEARRLLLVDGAMHVRVHSPHYHVGGYDQGILTVTYQVPAYTIGPRVLSDVSFTQFRPDRLDEAVAFMRAWQEDGGGIASTGCEEFEILRPDLLFTALPSEDVGDVAPHFLRELLKAAASCVGHCPEDVIARFVGLRARMNAIGGREAGIAAMEEARILCDDIAAARENSGWEAHNGFDILNAKMRAIFLRFDAIEVPRDEFAGDAESIVSLGR